MPVSEVKTCVNCKSAFVVDAEDFQFYEKIKVPAPTFCPPCRLQRRMSFINFIHLYQRKCGLCGKKSISKYPPEAPFVTYCLKCWYSDKWDPASYGRDYDFGKPFFEQFKELLHTVPILTLDITVDCAETSPFNNHAGILKNCYMTFFSQRLEDCFYGFYLNNDKSLLDCSLAMQAELCYDSRNIFKDNCCIGCEKTNESIDCAFLRDSINCQKCFASANLRNKKYYIWNQPMSKNEYEKEVKKYDTGSYKAYQELKKKTEEHWKKYSPKPVWDDFSTNCTGNYIFESKNCKECYEVVGAEDSKYLMMMLNGPVRDCYDITGWGDNLINSYEGYVGTNVSGARFCMETCTYLEEGDYTVLSSEKNLLGCVSMKNGRYCILNKQYSKKDFVALREKIIKQMNDMPYKDAGGRIYRYGEFFPIELSWCPYNDTLAQIFFPLTKEKALAEGYGWRDTEKSAYVATINASALPDHIKDANEEILKEAIACEACSRAYRIVHDELQFLRAMNLPLPRLCPFCRLEGNIRRWSKNLDMKGRKCSRCSVDFKTPYTKTDVPIIWCKKCYREETA